MKNDWAVIYPGDLASEIEAAKPGDHHYFAKEQHRQVVHWGYEGAIGPKLWGRLSERFRSADVGKCQSPIDIASDSTVEASLLDWFFDYRQEQIKSYNNGHIIQHDGEPGSFVHKSESGQMAVAAVLVEGVEDSGLGLPVYTLSDQEGEMVSYSGRRNPSDFLPQSPEYFQHDGSFTTPPCTEGIR